MYFRVCLCEWVLAPVTTWLKMQQKPTTSTRVELREKLLPSATLSIFYLNFSSWKTFFIYFHSCGTKKKTLINKGQTRCHWCGTATRVELNFHRCGTLSLKLPLMWNLHTVTSWQNTFLIKEQYRKEMHTMHIIRFGFNRYNILITDPDILDHYNQDTVFPHAVSLPKVLLAMWKYDWRYRLWPNLYHPCYHHQSV